MYKMIHPDYFNRISAFIPPLKERDFPPIKLKMPAIKEEEIKERLRRLGYVE